MRDTTHHTELVVALAVVVGTGWILWLLSAASPAFNTEFDQLTQRVLESSVRMGG